MLFDHHDRDLELFSKGDREVLSKEIMILEFLFVLGAALCGMRDLSSPSMD